MNEKIDTLMKQSYIEVDRDNRVFSPEKFAELIIEECIKQVEPTQHHEVWAQSYLGGVDGLDLLYSKVKQIKEYFGVDHE